MRLAVDDEDAAHLPAGVVAAALAERIGPDAEAVRELQDQLRAPP